MPGCQPLKLLRSRLEEMKSQRLDRTLIQVGPVTGPRVMVRGRDCLLMASNDYLGLSRHPLLSRAAQEAAESWGTSSGASRLVSGTLDGHVALERAIADFKGAEAAIFLATGYMTNLAVLTGLAGPGDLIVSDELNHASIIDASRLCRAQVEIYSHCNVEEAGRLLEMAPCSGLKLLVTDGVFSMDGDLAPLPDLKELARKYQALLVIDDAHATGVWGKEGRGTLEHFGMKPGPEVVNVGTISKALGGFGGFVAGASEVIETLVHRARSLLYTTAPPPTQVAVAQAALGLVDAEPWRRDKLHQLSARLRRNFMDMGFRMLSREGPIVPVLVGEAGKAAELAEGLWREGVFAPAIRPPTVAQGTSRIRFSVTAAHSEEDMDYTAEALAKASQEAGL